MNQSPHALLWSAVLILAALFVQSGLVSASSMELDPSFGNGGKVVHGWEKPDYSAQQTAMLLQPDGKLVLGGVVQTNADDFVLTRITADGQVDAGFGEGGVTITDFSGRGDYLRAVALAPGGMIVAGGSTKLDDAGNLAFAVARYLPDGRLDSGFAGDGRVVTQFPGSSEVAAVAVQSDNKVVAAGTVTVASDGVTRVDFAVARYNPDGSLDASFGNGGLRTIDFGGTSDTIRAVAVLGDGKILVAGTSAVASGSEVSSEFALAQLLPGGRLDSSFGVEGRVRTQLGRSAAVHDLAVVAGGKIVAAGIGAVECGSECYRDVFTFVRYKSNGQIDTSFGSGGTARVDFGSREPEHVHLAEQPDGKLLASSPWLGAASLVARLGPDGAIDPTLDRDGQLEVRDIGSLAEIAAVDAAGKFVLSGGFFFGPNGFVAARYNPDGSLDRGFGEGGRVIVPVRLVPTEDSIQEIEMAPDGGLVAVGQSGGLGQGALGLFLYNPDGSVRKSVRVGAWYLQDSTVGSALALQNDGKILIAGAQGTGGLQTGHFPRDFLLLRYNPDGSPDTSFGSNGVVIARRDHWDGEAEAIAVQPDGKILVAGQAVRLFHPIVGTISHARLLRYNPDGSLDATFANGGMTDPDSGAHTIHDIAIQDDGKIVAAIRGRSDTGDFFGLRRYNPDGSLDATFGGGGLARTDFGGNCGDAQAVVIQGDGKLVAAGFAGTCARSGPGREPNPSQFVLARYNADGGPDSSFAGGGKLVVDFPGDVEMATSLVIEEDGSLLAGGTAADSFALVRMATNGELDASFGDGGKLIIPFGGQSRVNALALQGDGKIVAAGQARSDGTYDFAVARLAEPPPPSPTPTIGPGCIFSDVCQSDYFFGAVEYLVGRGAISGYGDNTFRPYNDMTRGQLAKVVVLAEGWKIQTDSGPHFSDVPVENPFYQYVETAYARGIVSGYEDGTFRWSGQVTRGQLSKIIALAADWTLVSPAEPHFADVDLTNPFYSHVETLYAHGAISGYADGTFRWGNPATRGQLAKIVHLALGDDR